MYLCSRNDRGCIHFDAIGEGEIGVQVSQMGVQEGGIEFLVEMVTLYGNGRNGSSGEAFDSFLRK